MLLGLVRCNKTPLRSIFLYEHPKCGYESLSPPSPFFSSHYPFAFHNKNLAEKLSDFNEILTSKSTQMVFLVVKFLSKSDNFLAKFLNFL